MINFPLHPVPGRLPHLGRLRPVLLRLLRLQPSLPVQALSGQRLLHPRALLQVRPPGVPPEETPAGPPDDGLHLWGGTHPDGTAHAGGTQAAEGPKGGGEDLAYAHIWKVQGALLSSINAYLMKLIFFLKKGTKTKSQKRTLSGPRGFWYFPSTRKNLFF